MTDKARASPATSLQGITVVVPTLNTAPTLKKCLESIAKLDYPKERVELLVIDGGSVDETAAIATNLGAKVLIAPGTSRGAACNVGAKVAASEIIAFTDGDAAVSSQWLSSIAKEMAQQPELDAVGGPDFGMDEPSRVARTVSAFDLFRRRSEAYGWKSVFKIKGVNSAYKVASFLKLGGFDPSLFYGEESELHARMVEDGMRIKFSPRVIVYHRRHQQTMLSVSKVFRNARLMAPLIFRKWMIEAAMRDLTSPLTTLLSLFVAICVSLPILLIAWIKDFLLYAVVGLFFLTVAVSFVYAWILVSRTEGEGKFQLYMSTLLILPLQSALRALGITFGALDVFRKALGVKLRAHRYRAELGK